MPRCQVPDTNVERHGPLQASHHLVEQSSGHSLPAVRWMNEKPGDGVRSMPSEPNHPSAVVGHQDRRAMKQCECRRILLQRNNRTRVDTTAHLIWLGEIVDVANCLPVGSFVRSDYHWVRPSDADHRRHTLLHFGSRFRRWSLPSMLTTMPGISLAGTGAKW